MEQKKKVRLSDIADKLNVSTVTVSKALSNKDGVGDDLRQQIKELAEEMGYKVKGSASGNNSKVTGNIGILIPSRFFDPNLSFYWYIFNFLSTELLSRNYYSIMELLSDEDEKNLVLPRMIQDQKVDGVIVLGQINQSYIDELETNYPNNILLDFYTNNMELDCVSNDDYYCSYILSSYVISQGHKKLRFVGNFDATTSIRDRFMGFQKAALENKLKVSVDEIINDRDEKGLDIDLKLPAKEDMPTAFICNNDGTAAKLITTLEAAGYKVPDDVSVTGFDNFLGKNSINIGLTTVYIKPEDTASVAADLIIKKITGQPYIKGHHLVSGTLIIRDSVKSI
ncbi:MAG: LacI family DNA-binding transcriptional regulator [Treponema sp.]|nr:LacI family DNA-binding transcriptional regulator [Treponema sp.]